MEKIENSPHDFIIEVRILFLLLFLSKNSGAIEIK